MTDSITTAQIVTGLDAGGAIALPQNARAFIPSGDYKATDPTPLEFPTHGATGVQLFLNVTAQSGAGNTITINLDAFDPVSQTWFPLVTTFTYATGSAGTKLFEMDPRTIAVANQTVQHGVPDRVRCRPVGSGTRTTLNYSIGAALVL
jgi:hypothetical protein